MVQLLVPVKRFELAKSRLAGCLTADARQQLAEALLRQTLSVLQATTGITGILAVTADECARDICRSLGVAVLDDTASDLNGALELGRAALQSSQGANTPILVLPTDLPGLTSASLRALIERDPRPRPVTLVPDRQGLGTNALLLGSAADLPFRFGDASREAHRTAAATLGLDYLEVSLADLEQDLDLPADIGRLLTGDSQSPVLHMLHSFGFTPTHPLAEAS